jgi:hypothetical protein
MHGYRVTLQHGDLHTVEATGYVVGDDGTITFLGGDDPVERWGPGEWLLVDEFGTRLAERWPPRHLDGLVNEAATLLSVHYGHYVHHLRDLTSFAAWRCNDLDTMTAAILEQVGLTATTTDEYDSLRDLVARHFHLASPGS